MFFTSNISSRFTSVISWSSFAFKATCCRRAAIARIDNGGRASERGEWNALISANTQTRQTDKAFMLTLKQLGSQRKCRAWSAAASLSKVTTTRVNFWIQGLSARPWYKKKTYAHFFFVTWFFKFIASPNVRPARRCSVSWMINTLPMLFITLNTL